MSFVEQEDVFQPIEKLMTELFTEFGNGREVTSPFPRIPFREAMLKYGSDKPDLRAQLELVDITDVFAGSEFKAFAGKHVRALPVPDVAAQSRKFFDQLGDYAVEQGAKGLAWVRVGEDGSLSGPIAKFLTEDERRRAHRASVARPRPRRLLRRGRVRRGLEDHGRGPRRGRQARRALRGGRLPVLLDRRLPDVREGRGDRQDRLLAQPVLDAPGRPGGPGDQDPLDILAWQYDIVCNGIELSSGAIRNHEPELMLKAFEIAGYDEETVEREFAGMLRAFRFGAPPHGGIAPGVDRIVMLLADEPNIRETIAFPLNGNAQDLMMGAPTELDEARLRELHISVRKPQPK